jgi:hypothetical protein
MLISRSLANSQLLALDARIDLGQHRNLHISLGSIASALYNNT